MRATTMLSFAFNSFRASIRLGFQGILPSFGCGSTGGRGSALQGCWKPRNSGLVSACAAPGRLIVLEQRHDIARAGILTGPKHRGQRIAVTVTCQLDLGSQFLRGCQSSEYSRGAKHYWPDDPLVVEATARAQPRKS